MTKTKKKLAERRNYNSYLKTIQQHVGFKSLEPTIVTKTLSLPKSTLFNLGQAVKDEVVKDVDQFKNYDDMPCIPVVFDDGRCKLVGSLLEAVTETNEGYNVKITIPAIILKCKVGKLLHGEVRQIFSNSMKVRIADLFHCTVSLRNRKDRCSNYNIDVLSGICFRITSMGMGTGIEDYPEFKGTFKCTSKAYTHSMEDEFSEDEDGTTTYSTEDNKVTSDASTVLSQDTKRTGSKKVKFRTRSNNTPSNNHTTTDEEEDQIKPSKPVKKKPAEPVSKEYSAMLDSVIDTVLHKVHIELGISEDEKSQPIMNGHQEKEPKITDENCNHVPVVKITKTKLKAHKEESDSTGPASSQKSDEDFQIKRKKKTKKERRELTESHSDPSVDEWVNTSQTVAPKHKTKHSKSNQLSANVSISQEEQEQEDPVVTKKKKKKKKHKKSEVDSSQLTHDDSLINTTVDTSLNDSQVMDTTVASVNEVNGEVEPTKKKKKKKKRKLLNESEALPADDTVNQETVKSIKKKKRKHDESVVAVANETMNGDVSPKKKKKKNKKHRNEP